MRRLRPLIGWLGAAVCLLGSSPGGAALIRHDEPVITVSGVEGDYLRAIHKDIHWRWVNKFIDVNTRVLSAKDPLNNPALEAEVLFTIRWDGSPAEVTLSHSSGLPAFDAGAIAAIRSDMRFPVPPLDLFGDDGVAHFRWTFAADPRLCSGGEVRRREDPLEEALPRLLIQGRTKEALLRVSRHMRNGDPAGMSAFARAWLARPFLDPVADARAAAVLAHTGDRRQVERLQRALVRPDTVAVAAAGLAALKVDVCALVRPMLEDHDPKAAELGLRALRAAAAETGSFPPCGQALGTMATNIMLAVPLRAQALEAYAASDYSGARKLALASLEAPEAPLRAAGARAFARPDGGRPALYRLEPVLHDAAPEVRAAAAAALVRSCGDLARDYLQPLFKDRGDQALVAMAPELGHQSSPGSAEMLGRMLKRNDPELHQAVLAALAGRRDQAGRALFRPLVEAIKKDPRAPSDARLVAYSGADADELTPLARDPVVGILAFKALLRAKRHAEAADWLVASFDRLPPAELADAFGAWLATPPPRVAATSPGE
jgi:hypothetical protein